MSSNERTRFDLAVVGGGAAGVAAAHAAASGGAQVILIEGSNRLGGAVTAAMHRSLCGLYSHAPADALDVLNPGFQRKVVERMLALGGDSVCPRQMGRAWVLEFPMAAWEAMLEELVTVPRLERRMNTRVTSVRREGNQITAIEMDGKFWIEIKVLIDATGGGNVLQLLGEDVMQPIDPSRGRMLGGYGVRFAGLGGDTEMLRLQTPYALAQAVERGEVPAIARFTVFSPGPGPREGVCKLAIDVEKTSPDEVELFAQQIVAALTREVPGFADATVVERSPHALPRDGRCLRGVKTVTEADVLGKGQTSPTGAHAWWPIEQWDVVNGPTYAYPPEGQHYDIPVEALRSATIGNLLAAGSCVSATPSAAASIRASGICLATGAAAANLAM